MLCAAVRIIVIPHTEIIAVTICTHNSSSQPIYSETYLETCTEGDYKY